MTSASCLADLPPTHHPPGSCLPSTLDHVLFSPIQLQFARAFAPSGPTRSDHRPLVVYLRTLWENKKRSHKREGRGLPRDYTKVPEHAVRISSFFTSRPPPSLCTLPQYLVHLNEHIWSILPPQKK